MRKSEKQFFLAYVASTRQRFENEIFEMRRRIKYRATDAVELTEYMLLLERANAFEEFFRDTTVILHLNVDELEEKEND